MRDSRSFRATSQYATDTGKWISKFFIIQTAPTSRVVSSCPCRSVKKPEDLLSELLTAPIACLCTMVGLTVSKKVGHSPCRNLVKRRLRALIQTHFSTRLKKGVTYVFIARSAAATATSAEFKKELEWALTKLHKTFYLK